MEYRNFGRTGVKVSPLCLGCMMFGGRTEPEDSYAIIDRAIDAGINFLDTANVYSRGRSEEVTGEAIKRNGKRAGVFLATKVHGRMDDDDPNMLGNSRRHIVQQCEASLRRLQTDWIDLYQIHRPQPEIPIDETLRALDDLIRAGKVRIVGCSNETTWGLMKSIEASNRLGVARFQTIQNNFSLNHRRFEDELAQACRHEGVSLIPYSPLGGGVLSGKYQDGARPENSRFTRYMEMGGRQAAMARRFVNEKTLASTQRFIGIAAEAGLSPVTLATAWSKQHDFVASTIVGVTHKNQLPDILAAADMDLSDDVMKQIDKVSKEIMYPMG